MPIYVKLFLGEAMKKFKIILISILTSFCIYSERIMKEMVIVYEKIKSLKLNELIKFSYTNIDFLLIMILTIALIIFYNKYQDLKKTRAYNILSAVFSLFLVFGFSYSLVGNTDLITSNLIFIFISTVKFIVYYLFISTVLNLLALKIKSINLNKIKLPSILTKFENYYENHPLKTTLIIILVAWLPYFICFYPAILSPDPSNQILQYFGKPTHYIDGVKLLDENVVITNHHPVFHTFILGGFAKIGYNLGNINFGLFLFSCFQVFIVISAILYTLIYLKKIKTPFLYHFIILLIFALVPVFPLYALSSVKDTIFGALLIFYLIEFHKLITTKNYSKKEYVILGILILIMMLVRNNGIYIILFSILSLIIIVKDKRIPLLIVMFLSLFVYEAHNRILLPSMHITMGSVREMLSVPFQQTARYVKYHSADLSRNEIQTIDKILGYNTLGERYKANIADPVKNEYNKDTTTEDLIEYFKVWFSCFFRHPGTYFNATINTIYGYFYPNTSNWYIYHNYDNRLKEEGFDYHYNNLAIGREILSGYGVSFPYIPLIGSLVNIGLIIWTYLFILTYLIVENKKKLIPILIPALILLLTCIVGPVNTYFRYMVPIVMSLPLIIGILFNTKKETLTK